MDLVELADRLKENGMSMASASQDAENPGWSARCFGAIKALALNNPTIHVDQLLAAFKERPAHPNAWAAPWQRALREHIIIHSGRVAAITVDPRKRKRLAPVYLSLLYRRT